METGRRPRPNLTTASKPRVHVNDRTWNGTRGIPSDGIQRYKVRAVERAEHDSGSCGAQNHDPHPVEFAGRSEGQPAHNYGDGPGVEHPHLLRGEGKEGRCWNDSCEEAARTRALAAGRRDQGQATGESLGRD